MSETALGIIEGQLEMISFIVPIFIIFGIIYIISKTGNLTIKYMKGEHLHQTDEFIVKTFIMPWINLTRLIRILYWDYKEKKEKT